jgi:uncharacterized protein (TIGR03435 family)
MFKCIAIATAALISAGLAPAQAPLSFEVASIKPAAPCCAPGQWRESKAGDDRIDFRYVTLKYCIAFAYGMKEYRISGPAWVGELRYDIIAKASPGTRREQLPAMMQALLRDRFQLEIHEEKKEFSVVALLVGKNGPKLKESPSDPDAPAGASFGMSVSPAGVGRLEVKRGDMTALANTLPRLVGRPVVDMTGLTGRYDFDLEFSPQDANGIVMPGPAAGAAPAAPEFGVSVFTSIQRVGLKLEPQKLPLDAIVVVRAEKTPTEN